MKLQSILMSAAAFAALAACTPAAETPAPVAPPPADIAAAAPESGPAAENTTDTLASAPAADPAAAAATPGAPATAPAATPPAAPAAAAAPKADLAAGATVYARTCAMCHGPAGEGTVMGVALNTPHEAAKVKEKVTKGPINSGDKMPPLGAAMSAEELDAVSAYVAAGLKL